MSNLQNQPNDIPIVTNDIRVAQSWLKQHETLLIVFIIVLASTFLLDKGEGIVGQWEQHKASIAAQQVANDKAKNDNDLTQAKQTLEDYKTILAKTESENAKLVVQQSERNQSLAAQQKTDATLPPSELANRWSNLADFGDNQIQDTSTGYLVSSEAALYTVQVLEKVPVLQKNLKDEQTKSANLQNDVNKANTLIDQGKVVVNGLQTQLQDQQKACNAQISAEKAKARKGHIKAFFIGFVTGFVSGKLW